MKRTRLTFDVEAGSPIDDLIKYAVAPRPICFATTIDKAGNVNLSPFSYFNIMSHNPPICVFSPLRRMRDGSTKHTLENILEVPEVVINIVNYAMVQQQSLASTEYEKGVNEFEKSGLTMLPSTLIQPPRVAEAPVQLECKVREVISLGDQPGNGQLVLAEVLRMHIDQELINENGVLDQKKLDLVARLGGDWYGRINEDALFEVPKPLRNKGMGVDQLPEHVRLSTVLTGNHLGLLGNVEVLPDTEEVESIMTEPEIKELLDAFIGDETSRRNQLHHLAAKYLDQGKVMHAWKILLLP
jgi:flavin reductase (DIM6/NTAB) family NADH-FMN oxidoreductase RutF